MFASKNLHFAASVSKSQDLHTFAPLQTCRGVLSAVSTPILQTNVHFAKNMLNYVYYFKKYFSKSQDLYMFAPLRAEKLQIFCNIPLSETSPVSFKMLLEYIS